MQIEIETTDFVERTSKTGRKYYQAFARLDDGVQGLCFAHAPATAGRYKARLKEYCSERLKTGLNVETFVANLD